MRVLLLVLTFVCFQNNLLGKNSWAAYSSKGTVNFEWCKLSSERVFNSAGEIFAQSFAPIYPEAGVKSFPSCESFFDPHDAFVKKGMDYFRQQWKRPEFLSVVQELESRGALFTLGAFYNNKLVGFSLFTTIVAKDWKSFFCDGVQLNSDEKYLWLVAVDPEWQGRGLSYDLALSITDRFRTERILLRADVVNEPACRAYRRLRFREYDENRINYDKRRHQFFVWKSIVS